MKKITLVLALLTLSFGLAQSTPPGDLTCAGAASNGDLGSATSVTLTGTTILGTAGTNNGDSAWFQWTAPGDGTITVSSCNGGDDTRLFIHSDCVPTQIATNDDSCPTAPSGPAFAAELSGINVTNGSTYYIQWDDRWGEGPFDWSLNYLSCTPPAATTTAIDNCAGGTFTIDVNVTSLGNATSVTITNDGGAAPVQVFATGITNIGPFPIGTPVNVTLLHDQSPDCDVDLGDVSDGCPAANDECTTATPTSCGGTYTGNTGTATDSGGNAAPDVFFSYTGSGSAEDVTFSLCGSSYDTLIRVYDDCPQTNQIGINDDFCGLQSEVTFLSDGTTTYYVMVEGFDVASGNFTLNVSCTGGNPPPANDLCANAEPLVIGVQESGTTVGATDSSTGATDDTTCDGFSAKADVWYSFVASDSDVNITTTLLTTSDQANVAVYPNCSQLDAESLACSNGSGGESVDVTGLTASTTYFIRVWSDGVAPSANPDPDEVVQLRTEGDFTIVVNENLSTESFNISEFEYFPNPVDNTLTIRAQANIQNLAVYNMIGQEVMRMTPDVTNTEVDFSSLSDGAYFVKVSINDVTETIRIIKK